MSEQEVVKSENGRAKTTEPVRQRKGVEVAPPVDIFENEEELLLIADLPGVPADALQISLDPPQLRIEAPSTSSDVVYTRAFQVDDRIDPDGISAELVNGVLRLHLRKSETLRPRRIAVRAG